MGGIPRFGTNRNTQTDDVNFIFGNFPTAGQFEQFFWDASEVRFQFTDSINVTGTATSEVVEITGGSDLSENFDVTSSDTEVEPGMVVCIDAKQPGKLTVSSEAYDRTVAGIISGANGVKTGMLMGQAGTLAHGDHPIALTGRVYCMVDATQSAITPGDLLTTSDTPGHAMKVQDHVRAQGAIIGKAMTPLAQGEQGLVLVLVSLH
jgi:hypothetical protein